MVAPNEVVVIDPTFLLESSEKSFYGAPLFCGPQGEDNTVLYGVTRDLLRLRKSVGIANGIIVIGKEARPGNLWVRIQGTDATCGRWSRRNAAARLSHCEWRDHQVHGRTV